MKRILYYLLGILILCIHACNSNTQSSNSNSSEKNVDSLNLFLKEYAGAYTIEISGINNSDEIEAYTLHESGSAKWLYIVPDNVEGAKLTSEKTGTWTAEDGKISITIQGNAGLITEDYELKNGRFINVLISDRYLKETK